MAQPKGHKVLTFSNIFNSIHCAPVYFRLPKRCYLSRNQKKMAPFSSSKTSCLASFFQQASEVEVLSELRSAVEPISVQERPQAPRSPKKIHARREGNHSPGYSSMTCHSWSNFTPHDIQHSGNLKPESMLFLGGSTLRLWGDGEMWVLWGFTPTIAMFPKSFWHL